MVTVHARYDLCLFDHSNDCCCRSGALNGIHVRRSAVAATESKLQTPHGGNLVNLMLAEGDRAAAVSSCTREMELSDRNACDVELLCVG